MDSVGILSGPFVRGTHLCPKQVSTLAIYLVLVALRSANLRVAMVLEMDVGFRRNFIFIFLWRQH